MTNRRTTAALSSVAGITVALAVGLVLPSSASAAGVGTGTFDPATGNQDTNITMTTSALCPATATSLVVLVSGGDPATATSQVTNGVMVGLSNLSAFAQSNGGYAIPFTSTFKDFATNNGISPLKGDYAATVRCRTNSNGASLGDFTGTLRFVPAAGGGTYSVPAAVVAASPTPTPTPTHTASPSASATPAATPAATAEATATTPAVTEPDATSASLEATAPAEAPLGVIAESGAALPNTGAPFAGLLQLAAGLLAAGLVALKLGKSTLAQR